MHGGWSTGPITPDGRRRALEALARGRAIALERRRAKARAKAASGA
jgi:hypothetical protein